MNEPQNFTVKISGREVYKAVSNYLANSHNISKKFIEGQIDRRLEELISKQIKEEFKANHIINMIRVAIASYLRDGVPSTSGNFYFENRVAFDKWLQEKILQIVKEDVLSKYTIVLSDDKKKLIVEENRE